MFVMVEKGPGAFSLRFVCNEDVLTDLRAQGALDTFLTDVDELYVEFRKRMRNALRSLTSPRSVREVRRRCTAYDSARTNMPSPDLAKF